MKFSAESLYKSLYESELSRQASAKEALRAAIMGVEQVFEHGEKEQKWQLRFQRENIENKPVRHADYWTCGRLPLLSTGTHNGHVYEREDLVSIANASTATVPMGIGHGTQDILHSGGLAHAGLITRLYVEKSQTGHQLYGDVEYIPLKVGDAIFKKKRWTNRSVVIGNFRYDGRLRLLCCDWLGIVPPADAGINDITREYDLNKLSQKKGGIMPDKEIPIEDEEKEIEDQPTLEEIVALVEALTERVVVLEKAVESLRDEKEPEEKDAPKEDDKAAVGVEFSAKSVKKSIDRAVKTLSGDFSEAELKKLSAFSGESKLQFAAYLIKERKLVAKSLPIKKIQLSAEETGKTTPADEMKSMREQGMEV